MGALAVGGWLLMRDGMSKRRVIECSSALFFLTSAINVVALVGAGALLATSLLAGPHDLLLTAVPVVGGSLPPRSCSSQPGSLAGSPRRRAPRLAGRPLRRDRRSPSIGTAAELAAARCARLPRVRHRRARGDVPPPGHADPRRSVGARLPDRLPGQPDPGPGRLGDLEGGLAGALIVYGAPATEAAAAVIVYHAIAFWIAPRWANRLCADAPASAAGDAARRDLPPARRPAAAPEPAF